MKKKQNKINPVVVDELQSLDQPTINRNKFLAPYKEKYLDAIKRLHEIQFQSGVFTKKQGEENDRKRSKVEKEIAEVIATLIKREPSQLAEPWILRQVVEWMREHRYKDFIDDIFIKQKGRDRPTPDEEFNLFKDWDVYEHIEKLRNEAKRRTGKKLPVLAACKKLAFLQGEKPNKLLPRWSESNEEQELWVSIKKVYYRYKKSLNNNKLPYPYSDGMGGIIHRT